MTGRFPGNLRINYRSLAVFLPPCSKVKVASTCTAQSGHSVPVERRIAASPNRSFDRAAAKRAKRHVGAVAMSG